MKILINIVDPKKLFQVINESDFRSSLKVRVRRSFEENELEFNFKASNITQK